MGYWRITSFIPVQQFSYSSARELTACINSDGSTASYAYDANGNRTLTQSQSFDRFEATSVDTGKWTSGNPTPWSVSNGELSLAGVANQQTILTSKQAYGYTDLTAKVRMLDSSNKDVALIVRAQDENNFYLVRCSGLDLVNSVPQLVILKVVSGNVAQQWSTSVVGSQAGQNQTYVLRVKMDGTLLHAEYRFNGSTTILEANDSTYSLGKAGFRAYGSGNYRFDDAGLVTQSTYTFDTANQLTQIKDNGSVLTTLTYDASGNNVSEGISYRLYDERNRLLETSATNGSDGAVVYTYDALGRVISRQTRPLVFSDDFSAGISSSWQNTSSGWSTQSDAGNQVLQGDAYSGGAQVAWRNVGASDYTVSVKVKPVAVTPGQNGNLGIELRSDASAQNPENNTYYFGISPGESQWKLWKKVSGSDFSVVASGPGTYNLNSYYTLTAVAQGSTIKLYLDGALKYTYTDASYGFTNIALTARACKGYFEDIRVEGQTLSAATTYRYNDVTGALMHELDSSGNPTVTYVADASGNIMAVQRGGIIYHYHYNAHGDVVAITRDDGTVKARFSYDSWGAPTEYDSNGQVVDLGTWANTPGNGLFLLFGGMLYDAAAGLYLTKTRAYNPKTGRFLQRDILDESGKSGVYGGFPFGRDAIGTNLYAWCKNNPVNYLDPSGLDPAQVLGAIIGACIGGVAGYILGGVDGAIAGAYAGAQAGYALATAIENGDINLGEIAGRAAAEEQRRRAEAARIWEEMRQKFNSQSTASANAGLLSISKGVRGGFSTDGNPYSIDMYNPVPLTRSDASYGERIVTEAERCSWGFNTEMEGALQYQIYGNVQQNGRRMVFKRTDWAAEYEAAKLALAIDILEPLMSRDITPSMTSQFLAPSGVYFTYGYNPYPRPKNCLYPNSSPIDTRPSIGPFI